MVKVISLPYIFQVLYVLCFTWTRYQVSVYRTIGPLVYSSDAEGPVRLELPNQWLWDIIDEFIYQFQSFSIYRCKITKKPAEEIDVLRANPKVGDKTLG